MPHGGGGVQVSVFVTRPASEGRDTGRPRRADINAVGEADAHVEEWVGECDEAVQVAEDESGVGYEDLSSQRGSRWVRQLLPAHKKAMTSLTLMVVSLAATLAALAISW